MNLLLVLVAKTLLVGAILSLGFYFILKGGITKLGKNNGMVKQIALLLGFLMPISLCAQTSASIKGNIIDNETKNPLGFSSVALYSVVDSNLVKGVNSDENGNFLFADVPQGEYYINISYLGYQKTSTNSIKIDDQARLFDIGMIELKKEVKELEVVEIKGEMLKAKQEVDRTVYVVNSQMAGAAHSGLEILRQVPTVEVDFQNHISVNGSSNILIFVDGKERDGEYLAQLNPASIEKIEVMDNPSAKYNADISAVLFVITKKEARLGITGRIETELPLSPQIISNNSASIEYGFKNIRVFVSDNLHYEKFDEVELNTSRESEKNNINSKLVQNGTGLGIFPSHKIHYGFDWFLNEKNSVSFYGNYRPPIFEEKMDGTTTTQLFENNTLTEFFKSDGSQHGDEKSQYYSLFFKHCFSKPSQELTGDVNYYKFEGLDKNTFNIQYYQSDGLTPSADLIVRDETTKNHRDRIRTKFDYSHPLNDNLKIETGYEGEIQWYDNTFYITNDQLADRLEYQEIRNAGYASVAGKVKEFSFQAGLRGEHANILINNDTTSRYFCLLPQVNLQHKFGKGNTLKLTYRKSIKRPGVSDLNPFIRYSDSLNLSRGNPELDPSYNHTVELKYTKNIKSHFISPAIYVMHFNDMYNSIVTVNEDNVSETYVDNVGKGMEYGIKLQGGVQALKFWRINPDLTMFYKELHGDRNASVYNIPDQDRYCWRGGITSLMFFPKDITFILYGRYNSPNINPQVISSRSPVYIVALQKGLFKKKGELSIFSYLPFWKEFIADKQEYNGRDFTQTSSVIIKPDNLFTVRFSYKFDYGNKVKKIERNNNIEEENGGGLF